MIEFFKGMTMPTSRGYFSMITIGTTSIYSGAGNPNGVVSAVQGSVFLSTAGAVYVNTDGADTWLDLGALGVTPSWGDVLGVGSASGGVNPILTNGDALQGEDQNGAQGGDMVIQAGDNLDNTDLGGSLTARAGSGDIGGNTTLDGGQGISGEGGDVLITGGTGATDGGPAIVSGGSGANGGDATIQGGPGGGGVGNQGGAVRLLGRDGDPAGIALLQGGDGIPGAAGADAIVRGGSGTGPGGHARLEPGPEGSGIVGTGALLTTATDGFLYIPSTPGPPTGVPTPQAGLIPFVFDSVNNDFYAYISGAWVSITLT